ncbi:MAG TPA: coproporphyrinogen-III oxidase family protein, partial [Kofleriaceae bacterium]|nr:coproporphyrinogen-III oxidase family protein [Kofleriaceae bacterium]
WCRALCPYCDFPVAIARHEPPHAGYRDRVLAELAAQSPRFAGRALRSIYVGGGTPSLWDPAALGAVIAAAAAAFAADPAALEITVEANPIDCTPERMAGWRAIGVNRLSIGVQAWRDDELAALGRDHRQGDGPAALAAARAAGFGSFSADLILGAPGIAPPPPGQPTASVVAAAASGAPHLSVYELTIERRTAFGRRARAGTLPLAPEDAQVELYTSTHAALTAAGFEHYEISSYARPGARAVHNQLYWRGAEYLGLGVGAASFQLGDDGAGERWTNVRQWPRYARGEPPAEETHASAREVATDRLWLAMRTSDGAPVAELPSAVVDWALAGGLATVDDAAGRLRPTLRGFLFADEVAARIVAAAAPRRPAARRPP